MRLQIAPRTVVEAFLPFCGETSLADIYDTANLAGMADQPVRLAIRRLIANGDIVQRGRGRAGNLSLTSAGRSRLQRDRHGLALAYAQDAGEAPWDGRWHLTAVSIPERDRTVRDLLRRELAESGAATISTGLYLSPHDLLGALGEEVRRYLSTATSRDLNFHGLTAPFKIAQALWPSGPILAAYRAVDEMIVEDSIQPSIPNVVRQLRLADALERALRDDPLLPPELRESAWTPKATRAAWAERWGELQSASGMLVYRGWWPPRT